MSLVVRCAGIAVVNTFLAQVNFIASDLRAVVRAFNVDVDRLCRRTVMAVIHLNAEIQVKEIATRFGMSRIERDRTAVVILGKTVNGCIIQIEMIGIGDRTVSVPTSVTSVMTPSTTVTPEIGCPAPSVIVAVS